MTSLWKACSPDTTTSMWENVVLCKPKDGDILLDEYCEDIVDGKGSCIKGKSFSTVKKSALSLSAGTKKLKKTFQNRSSKSKLKNNSNNNNNKNNNASNTVDDMREGATNPVVRQMIDQQRDDVPNASNVTADGTTTPTTILTNQLQSQRKGLRSRSRKRRDKAEAAAAVNVTENAEEFTTDNARSAPSIGLDDTTTEPTKTKLLPRLFTKKNSTNAANATATSTTNNNDSTNKSEDQLKVVYKQFGDASVLHLLSESGIPSPEAADHVVIKIQASTVTLDDCQMRRGLDFDVLNPVCLPQTPGSDVIGNVVCAGSKAYGYKEGERVAALVRTGGNARYISIPANHLVKVPRGVDSTELVAMVSVYTTAYQTLKRITQKGPMFSLLDKKVLVVGGMDAVGQALIQMCNKARAEIYATGPSKHHSYIKDVLGATPVPENKDEWLPLMKGLDFVFDGECTDGLESPHSALKQDGELVNYGHSSVLQTQGIGVLGAPMLAHMNKLWGQTKSRTRTLSIWESFKEEPETYKKNLKSLCQLLKWNKIKPRIVKTVSLSGVQEAQKQLESKEIFGLVVCQPWKKYDSDQVIYS